MNFGVFVVMMTLFLNPDITTAYLSYPEFGASFYIKDMFGFLNRILKIRINREMYHTIKNHWLF